MPASDTSRTGQFVRYWLPVVIWAGTIFYFSGVPNLRFVDAWWDIIVRKVGHMGVFGILALLFSRPLKESLSWSKKDVFVWSLLLTFLYACTDEYHQSFTVGRHGSPVDVGIDAVGAWLALTLRFVMKPAAGANTALLKGAGRKAGANP